MDRPGGPRPAGRRRCRARRRCGQRTARADRGVAGGAVPGRAGPQGGRPSSPPWAGFTGDDRFMADYLWSELLGQLPPERVAFLTRTAVLERMSGPLCDAVLDTTGSSAVLAWLEESNLLLVPLDRQRRWYRYHHLFQELLSAELGRREPDLVPELHARAASWCEANGLPETAIDHAQAAGDTDRVARLVWELALPAYGAGRARHHPPLVRLVRGPGPARTLPGRWPCSGPGCRPWSVSRRRPSAGPTRPNTGRSRGRCRTAAPARATWRCCGRCCAATAWTGCGPTPRPPWTSSVRPASGGPPPSCWRGSATCSPVRPTRPTRSWPTPPRSPPKRRCAARGRDRPGRALAGGHAPAGLAAGRHPGRAGTRRWFGPGRWTAMWPAPWSTPWRPGWPCTRATCPAPNNISARATRLRPLLTYALPYFAVQTLLELGRACLALDDGRRRQGGAAPSPRHPPAPARPRHPPPPRWTSCGPARHQAAAR